MHKNFGHCFLLDLDNYFKAMYTYALKPFTKGKPTNLNYCFKIYGFYVSVIVYSLEYF